MIFLLFKIATTKLLELFWIFFFTVSKYIPQRILSKHFALLSIVWFILQLGALESPLGSGPIGLKSMYVCMYLSDHEYKRNYTRFVVVAL